MPKKILFIDDEPEFVRPQLNGLLDAGYDVHLAPGPTAALTSLREAKFDLIILDLIMPPLETPQVEDTQDIHTFETGVILHERIREDLELVDIPILFLTVIRDPEIRTRINHRERDCGQEPSYVTKPIRTADLVTKVQEILGDS